MKFFYAMFGFTGFAEFVSYGKGLPSESHWMIPGSWEDA